jgi:hypothetical protein
VGRSWVVDRASEFNWFCDPSTSAQVHLHAIRTMECPVHYLHSSLMNSCSVPSDLQAANPPHRNSPSPPYYPKVRIFGLPSYLFPLRSSLILPLVVLQRCSLFLAYSIIIFQMSKMLMKLETNWGPFLGLHCPGIYSLVRSDLQVGFLHHTCGWVAESRPLTPLSLVHPAGTFDPF